jgi:PAS domain S-box-containing protein
MDREVGNMVHYFSGKTGLGISKTTASSVESSNLMVQAHKSVEEVLEQKARLLDLSNDAILARDASDRITFWNQGATDTYGFHQYEAIGQVSHDLLRTEFPEPLQSIKEKLAQDGRWAGELRHKCANGSSITVSSRWVAERDESGNVISILESNRDISGMKRAHEVQSRLAAIIESSDDAIVSKNLDGIITSWNGAAERIFGFTAGEAVGKHIGLIIPRGRMDEETDILARLRRGERIDHFETVRRKKDETLFDVSVTISPVRNAEGRIIGASKVARDITERKRLEHAMREAELSGRLLQLQDEERRQVARELHDGVGQLLAALSMNAHVVADEKTALSLRATRCIEENLGFIDQAIREIRTISYLLHPPFLDEVGLTSALSEYVQGFGERSKIAVSVELSPDSERLPHDVELSLFRVVQECLTNIHRHSGSRTARVLLSRAPGEIRLEVSDQGKGINPEIQESALVGRSAGVGLRGMRERVRRLGGTLQIQSNPSGTSVLVVLPLRAQDGKENDPNS